MKERNEPNKMGKQPIVQKIKTKIKNLKSCFKFMIYLIQNHIPISGYLGSRTDIFSAAKKENGINFQRANF
jgi:hypothetical protein